MKLPKIEVLREDLAAGTESITVDGGTHRYFPVGNCYLSSAEPDGSNPALLTTLAALIGFAVPGSTVTLSPTTGKVTITFGTGTHTLEWSSAVFRNGLGFTGNLTPAAASFTGTRAAAMAWLPNVAAADLLGSYLSPGGRSEDVHVLRATSGQIYRTEYNKYRPQKFTFRGLTKQKVWFAEEVTAHESWEYVWGNFLPASGRFRYYRDATDDTSYADPSGITYDYVYHAWQNPVRITRSVDALWEMRMDADIYVA